MTFETKHVTAVETRTIRNVGLITLDLESRRLGRLEWRLEMVRQLIRGTTCLLDLCDFCICSLLKFSRRYDKYRTNTKHFSN